jgi:hypothetical protein
LRLFVSSKRGEAGRGTAEKPEGCKNIFVEGCSSGFFRVIPLAASDNLLVF